MKKLSLLFFFLLNLSASAEANQPQCSGDMVAHFPSRYVLKDGKLQEFAIPGLTHVCIGSNPKAIEFRFTPEFSNVRPVLRKVECTHTEFYVANQNTKISMSSNFEGFGDIRLFVERPSDPDYKKYILYLSTDRNNFPPRRLGRSSCGTGLGGF